MLRAQIELIMSDVHKGISSTAYCNKLYGSPLWTLSVRWFAQWVPADKWLIDSTRGLCMDSLLGVIILRTATLSLSEVRMIVPTKCPVTFMAFMKPRGTSAENNQFLGINLIQSLDSTKCSPNQIGFATRPISNWVNLLLLQRVCSYFHYHYHWI